MAKEIERKFLVDHKKLPLLVGYPNCIRQYYLSHPGSFPVVRVRIIQNEMSDQPFCRMTMKGDGDLVRDEIEFDIPYSKAEDIVQLWGGLMVQKKRYNITYPNVLLGKPYKIWEIDVFEGDLAGLCLAEIGASWLV
jgi:adenylate cyclase